MVAVVDNGGRFTFQNADGDWHLWKQPTHMASGSTLSRKWEATRWASAGAGSPPMNGRPHVGVMLHAWEGGSGYPDCRNCYVPVVPGNTYQAFMCFSFDTGWVV